MVAEGFGVGGCGWMLEDMATTMPSWTLHRGDVDAWRGKHFRIATESVRLHDAPISAKDMPQSCSQCKQACPRSCRVSIGRPNGNAAAKLS